MNENTHPLNERNTAPEFIAKALTQSASQLDSGTIVALRRARHIALERQLVRKAAFQLETSHGTHSLIPHSTQQWALAALLAALLVSFASYWHHAAEQDRNLHDTSPLDIAILTDDMPMEMFVDK